MSSGNTVWSHIALLILGLGGGYLTKDWMVRGEENAVLKDIRVVESEDVQRLIDSNNRVTAIVQQADKSRSKSREVIGASNISDCPVDDDTSGMLWQLAQETNGPKSRSGAKAVNGKTPVR